MEKARIQYMSNKKEMNPDDLFLLWKKQVKEIGKSRYTSAERKEQIDLLCELFYKHNIDLDEAKLYKRKVVELLVTKDGMKGNGKYKGWKENTEEDFDATLISWYQGEFEVINDTTKIKELKKEQSIGYGNNGHIERHRIIVAWTKHKFGDNWSESICLEAHRVGSQLWVMFEKEVFYSEWAKNDEIPWWLKKVL